MAESDRNDRLRRGLWDATVRALSTAIATAERDLVERGAPDTVQVMQLRGLRDRLIRLIEAADPLPTRNLVGQRKIPPG